MSVEDLFVRDERGHMAVNGLCFDVRKGEVLGIAGVQGNGQTELVYALTGLLPIESGKIELVHRDDLAPGAPASDGTRHGTYSRRPAAPRAAADIPDLRQSGAVQLLPAALRQGRYAPA